MEKIYMEDNKQRQKKKVVDFSVVLSFVVAIFAIVSLATFGVVSIQGNGITYAAPIDIAGDEFNFYQQYHDGSPVFIRGISSNGVFNVPMYFADENLTLPIFCVEHKASVDGVGKPIYKRDGLIEDYGLLYLLDHSLANGVTNVPGGNKYVETWITQVAIWVYMYETNSNPSNTYHVIDQEELNAIESAQTITVTFDVTNEISVNVPDVYNNYVRKLVDEAEKASNVKRLSVNSDDTIKKSSDGKYYQTSAITVVANPADDLESFDISVDGIEGVSVVNTNGEKMNLTNVSPGTTFYVQIPADKVTQNVQNFVVSVRGHFKTLSGHYFVSKDGKPLQKVVTVTGSTVDHVAGKEFEIVGVPDTGMNTAQKVYFVGLIVLLSGVGIVYANAKPVKVQQ